jgi:hypothetical protein
VAYTEQLCGAEGAQKQKSAFATRRTSKTRGKVHSRALSVVNQDVLNMLLNIDVGAEIAVRIVQRDVCGAWRG